MKRDIYRFADILLRLFTLFLRASAMLKHVIDSPSVHPSHAGTVSKRLNILSCFLHHTIAHSFICVYQNLSEIPTGSPPAGPLNRGGV